MHCAAGSIRPRGSTTLIRPPSVFEMYMLSAEWWSSGVIVDVCRAHGTFFDVGELPRVIEYVQQGGLEKAEKKEIARMHEQAKSEQRKAQAAAMSAARVSGDRDAGAALSTGGALVDLLTSLFG